MLEDNEISCLAAPPANNFFEWPVLPIDNSKKCSGCCWFCRKWWYWKFDVSFAVRLLLVRPRWLLLVEKAMLGRQGAREQQKKKCYGSIALGQRLFSFLEFAVTFLDPLYLQEARRVAAACPFSWHTRVSGIVQKHVRFFECKSFFIMLYIYSPRVSTKQ